MSNKYKELYYYDIVNNKSQWKKPNNENVFLVNTPSNWEGVLSSKYDQYYFFNENTHKSQWKLPEQTSMNGLRWTGNSCYMDSILQSIFGPGNTVLTNGILNENLDLDKRTDLFCTVQNRKAIQRELIKIDNIIKGYEGYDETVKEFRKTLRKCRNQGGEDFYGNEMRDSGEFLDYLLNMFPISRTAKLLTVTYATNNLSNDLVKEDFIETSKISDNNSYIINTIYSDELYNLEENTKLSEFLIKEYDSGELSRDNLFSPDSGVGKGHMFLRRIQFSEVIDAPALIFSLQRTIINENYVVETKVLPEEKITLASGRKLELTAVTVYVGRHYICYFKCNNKWYLYDDNGHPLLKEIGIYNDLDLENIGSKGTQFFYT
jgi:hypothetical protein